MKTAILSMYSGLIDRGVETWTREFAKRLSEDSNVLVLQGSDEKIDPLYKSKIVRVRVIWKLRKGESWLTQYLTGLYWTSLNLSFTIRTIPHLIKFQPDIVLPTNGGVQTLLIKIFSKLFGWKMVVVGHAGIGMPEKWNLLMRPDLYIMPSSRGKNWAEQLIYSKGIKIVNIPHGIDLEKFNPKMKSENVKLVKPIILCVSSFDPYKRVDLVIKAVDRLNEGSLLIVGGDLSSGKTAKLAKELLGKRCKIIKVKPSKMPAIYSSVDVFTLPSNEFEAFGIVYLEALASNLPVVATDDELRREIVGGAGILVDPTNIEEYSKALNSALQKDWEDKPRKQAEKFAWDRIIVRYEEEFKKLIYNNQ